MSYTAIPILQKLPYLARYVAWLMLCLIATVGPVAHAEDESKLKIRDVNVTLDEGVNLVLHALDRSLGGELYVPQIPSYRITEVADAIGPDCEKPVVGIRPGEKIHEEMVTETDALQTISTGKNLIIVPMLHGRDQTKLMAEYCKHHAATQVPENFSYNSGRNTEWLSVPQIRQLIRDHVDPTFDLT